MAFKFNFTPEQHDAIHASGRSLLVSAAAGSGKTRVLTERVLSRVCDEGCDITDFLIITFTNAAAAELRDRIAAGLDERMSMCGERGTATHLRKQLALIGGANISTIDAFCMSLIREFSYKLGISSSFGILEDTARELMRAEAMENSLDIIYDSADPDIAAFLARLGSGRSDNLITAAVTECFDAAGSHPFPDIWMEDTARAYADASSFEDTVWGSYLMAHAVQSAAYMRKLLEGALKLLGGEPELNEKYAETFRADLRLVSELAAALEQGWDEAAQVLEKSPGKLASAPRNYPDQDFKERIKGMRDSFKGEWAALGGSICESSAAHIGETGELYAPVSGLFKCVKIFRREYTSLKRLAGKLDFSDLGHLAVELLCERRDGRIACSETGDIVGSRYREVLIDEYQDTNGIQDAIAEALTGNRDNLFMVGDVKQSIYRFRLAEPELFMKRSADSAVYSADLPEGLAARISLSKNFRSSADVTAAVNHVFSKIMTGGPSEIAYGPEERLVCGREADSGNSPETELYILDAETPDDDEDSPARTEQEAAFVAGQIARLLCSGMTVDEDGAVRPLRPSDIAILMRSVTGRAEVYEAALLARGIPSSAGGGRPERTAEVSAVLSILYAIDNPYNDIPLIAAMLSPLFSFTPEELASIRAGSKRGSFYEAVRFAAESGDGHSAEFLESLAALREYSYENTVDMLLWHIYTEWSLPALYGILLGGGGRREALMLLYEHAGVFVSGGGRGPASFAEYAGRLIDRGLFSASATAEAGVKIMSVHKSKGLEFPVVILPDLAKKFNLDDTRGELLIHPALGVGMKIFDEQRMYRYPTAVYSAISSRLREQSIAEEMRVLYVAMTRARDKLIMTCSFAGAERKVARLLAGGLDTFTAISAQNPAAWLIPAFALHPGGRVMRELSPGYPFEREAEGRFIAHYMSLADSGRDEAILPDMPADIADVPSEETTGSDTGTYLRLIDGFIGKPYPFAGLELVPSKLTATELKGKRLDPEIAEGADTPDITPAEAATDGATDKKYIPLPSRPRFSMEKKLSPAERGTALHTVMQFVDFERCGSLSGIADEIKRLEAMRLVTPEQAAAADPEKILRFTASPLYERIRAAETVRREFKFSILSDAAGFSYPDYGGEQVLLQGVCDLFFVEDEKITIVDFKSDRVTAKSERAHARIYSNQLGAYAHAVSRIYRLPVAAKLIFFFETGNAVEI